MSSTHKNLISLVLFIAWIIASHVATAVDSSVLRSGDVVSITVYGQQDLNTVTRVAGDGGITFPFIGDLSVGGLTTGETERKIAYQLGQGGFVKNAQVSVFLQERIESIGRSVTILGQVEKSGLFPLATATEGGVDTLINLLAMAGGVNAAGADHLLLLRSDEGGQKTLTVDLVDLLTEGDVTSNYRLQDGDIIIVPQMQVFYIYGQVQRPGRYRLEKDMTVMQAIAVASGITERGSEKGVQLRRRDADNIRSFNADLTDELQANDVIYVKESFF
jgi:polysaccharide export outer membrane protein